MFDPTRHLTLPGLQAMRQRHEKIVALTAYDASFARILDEAGVDVILVGDSLGMVIQGHETTLPVTLDDMVYHTRIVARGINRALLVADLPYLSYTRCEQALDSAARLIRAGAQMVKLEGGRKRLDIIRALVDEHVPVCGHLGLLPQAVYQMGGFIMQGRDSHSAKTILEDALLLQEAGVSLLILEGMPAELAAEITEALTIPTLGIGAGPDCGGQILVLYDLLGITPGKRPRFARDFLRDTGDIRSAINHYVSEVRAGRFPSSTLLSLS